MSRAGRLKQKIAGKAKQAVGEILGDHKLHDEGKAQEKEGHNDRHERKLDKEQGKFKPLGNLNQLT